MKSITPQQQCHRGNASNICKTQMFCVTQNALFCVLKRSVLRIIPYSQNTPFLFAKPKQRVSYSQNIPHPGFSTGTFSAGSILGTTLDPPRAGQPRLFERRKSYNWTRRAIPGFHLFSASKRRKE